MALVSWARMMTNAIPELRLLFAIPNGGARNPKVAEQLKAEGVKAGVPDYLLPVARRNFHGLFIELKALDGAESAAQKDFRELAQDQGYRCEVARGAEVAIDLIYNYLQETT